MFATSRPKLTHLFAALAVVALATVALVGAPAAGGADEAPAAAPSRLTAEQAIAQIEGADGVLRFDVAEDHSRFTWGGSPPLTDGVPTADTPFIGQGYIYPEGTLTESNGVLADGSPEFPDKVLGQWTCYGWYVGAGKPGETAPWITTHLFNFGGAAGEATLVTEGYSIDDLVVTLDRTVAGGTGPYAGARGVQRETNLGFNASDGINVRYEVRLAEP